MTSPGRPLSSMATLPTATQSWKGREWMRKDPWQWYEVMNVFVGNPHVLHVSATSKCMNRMNSWFLHPTPLADLSIRLAGEASQNKPLCRFAKIFTSPVPSLNINEIHVNMISTYININVKDDLCRDEPLTDHWLIGQRGDDYLVGLSMFSDVRMSWKPDVLEARSPLANTGWCVDILMVAYRKI